MLRTLFFIKDIRLCAVWTRYHSILVVVVVVLVVVVNYKTIFLMFILFIN